MIERTLLPAIAVLLVVVLGFVIYNGTLIANVTQRIDVLAAQVTHNSQRIDDLELRLEKMTRG